jgi:hypothetical protein
MFERFIVSSQYSATILERARLLEATLLRRPSRLSRLTTPGSDSLALARCEVSITYLAMIAPTSTGPVAADPSVGPTDERG